MRWAGIVSGVGIGVAVFVRMRHAGGDAEFVSMSSEVPAAERDLWLLVATAESEVPLAVAKVGRLSGISLHPVAPYRSERDAITLGPRLTVTGAATMSNSQRQDFTYFGVEASPCGSLDDAFGAVSGARAEVHAHRPLGGRGAGVGATSRLGQ